METVHTLSLQIAITGEERQKAINLLQKSQLPVSDLDDDKLLYLLKESDRTIGTAGLEVMDDCGLLRSVSIIKQEQRKGYGKFLVDAMESYARESGITCLYLLTTAARDFFDKQGYCVIKREDAPEVIKQTSEFLSLCSSTAIVMKKRL
ncbi:MAG TPA: arsenic resistance N-acetyltransferase ArsN2 [Chitinophagaceae bacterium]|nr:arsenic resistance N-acetyltransferase ArsN2 [Chitinophagaceae bacterium]